MWYQAAGIASKSSGKHTGRSNVEELKKTRKINSNRKLT